MMNTKNRTTKAMIFFHKIQTTAKPYVTVKDKMCYNIVNASAFEWQEFTMNFGVCNFLAFVLAD